MTEIYPLTIYDFSPNYGVLQKIPHMTFIHQNRERIIDRIKVYYDEYMKTFTRGFGFSFYEATDNFDSWAKKHGLAYVICKQDSPDWLAANDNFGDEEDSIEIFISFDTEYGLFLFKMFWC